MATQALKIALLGAESSGKTQLARDLAAHYVQQGKRVQVVAEYLREWCAHEGRTPRQDEQLSIAREQARRVDKAAACDVLIADTTALMVAVYSAHIFADATLYDAALVHQRSFTVTLLTGLDLPWVADGIQRTGPHVQPPVDALIRSALQRTGQPFQVVYGSGTQRLQNALNAIHSVATSACEKSTSSQFDLKNATAKPFYGYCERCSQPDCEHRLFTALVGKQG